MDMFWCTLLNISAWPSPARVVAVPACRAGMPRHGTAQHGPLVAQMDHYLARPVWHPYLGDMKLGSFLLINLSYNEVFSVTDTPLKQERVKQMAEYQTNRIKVLPVLKRILKGYLLGPCTSLSTL